MILQPIPRLLILKQEGCPSCEEAAPAIARLMREHPLDLLVTQLDIGRYDWGARIGWQPSGTPAYALIVEGRIRKKHVGGMSYDELLDWLGFSE